MDTKHAATPRYVITTHESSKDGFNVDVTYSFKKDGATVGYTETVRGITSMLNAHDDLVDALMSAMCFVEDAAGDECYKYGAVTDQLNKIRAALTKAGAL